MRIIRILLQVLIAALYGLALFVLLRPPFSLGAFLGISAFFAFLFLLTLLLREHTESRLVVGRQISPRVQGTFIVFAGFGLCYLSFRLVAGLPFSSGRRGQLLASIVDVVGPWPPAIVFAGLGFQLLFIGYHVFRVAKT